MIFLKTRAGNGNHIDVEGTSVMARWQSHGNWQALTIQKNGGGAVHSGDIVYVQSHTGAYLDVQDTVVRARWAEMGDWQAMLIEKRVGNGPIMADDIVCLRATHTDKHLDVEDAVVQARCNDCGDWQALMIEKEVAGAIFSGDSVTFLAHTGNRVEVEGTAVAARWDDAGVCQTFSIHNYGGVPSSQGMPYLFKHTLEDFFMSRVLLCLLSGTKLGIGRGSSF